MTKQTYPSCIRASEISELVQNKSPSMDPAREFIERADYDELNAAKEALFRMHQDVCDRAIKLAEDRDFWKQQAGMVTNKLAAEVIENDKLRKIIAEPGEGNRYRLLMNENERLQAELRLSRTITEQLQRGHRAMEKLMAVPAGEYETELRTKINNLESQLTTALEVKAMADKLAEALRVYTKNPEYKEVEKTMNFCMDDCPRDCNEHNMKHMVKTRPVCQPKSVAIQALAEWEAIWGKK